MAFKLGTRIGFDMDDVICDTRGALITWAEQGFGRDLGATDDATIHELLTTEEAPVMKAMLDEGAIFGDLTPKPNAVKTLEDLTQHHDIFIVTAAMEHPGSFGYKFEWIAKHLPFFDPLKVVFCGEKYVADVDVLVDDSPHHFKRLRGEGVVFSAPKNRGETRYRRVNTWNDVRDLFLPG